MEREGEKEREREGVTHQEHPLFQRVCGRCSLEDLWEQERGSGQTKDGSSERDVVSVRD